MILKPPTPYPVPSSGCWERCRKWCYEPAQQRQWLREEPHRENQIHQGGEVRQSFLFSHPYQTSLFGLIWSELCNQFFFFNNVLFKFEPEILQLWVYLSVCVVLPGRTWRARFPTWSRRTLTTTWTPSGPWAPTAWAPSAWGAWTPKVSREVWPFHISLLVSH